VRNARDAARAGADFAVVMSPFFLRLDQVQMASYCTTIADGSPLPVVVYHHLRMPTPIEVATVARLADHPNIVGLKDTNGGDQDRCAEILAATAGPEFQFYQGVEKLVLSTLRAGGHGCVVAQACIAPRLFCSLLTAHAAGDASRADETQAQIDALWAVFSQPEVRQSFSHFLYTLKLPLQQRGIFTSTAGAVPGVVFEPEFERMITDFMQAHLELPALHHA
jgi:dihydrodipicolinate synthase/N-acetylneuraminate lyase